MKKRHVLYAVIGLEIASLPFSARAIHHALSASNDYAVLTAIPSVPGVSRLVISSNTPFIVTSEGARTPLDIRVNVSGFINETRFGDNAQLPGLPAVCIDVPDTSSLAIYTSERATSIVDTDILGQSVIMEINYDQAQDPKFAVQTLKAGRKIPKAPACGAALL